MYVNKLVRVSLFAHPKHTTTLLSLRGAAEQAQSQTAPKYNVVEIIRSGPEKKHHFDIEPNSGPNITADYIPIPCHPYAQVNAELQNKFNMYLGASVLIFLISCYIGWKYDAFWYEGWSSPESYRNRKAINAKLRAQEAAEASSE